jgi:hypothetical protein
MKALGSPLSENSPSRRDYITLWYLRCTPPELHLSGIIGEGAPEVKLAVV